MTSALAWTIHDLDAMPDDGGWTRHEIIDGELYVTRAPHIFHQDTSGLIYAALLAWSQQSQLGKPFLTPGVIFSPTDAVIPDVAWVSQTRLATGVDDAGHFTVAPDLIVEVLSPGDVNEQRDREFKRKLYSRYGVQEYWVVSWQRQTVEIYQRQEAQLTRIRTLLPHDHLTSPLLPGFGVDVAQLFS